MKRKNTIFLCALVLMALLAGCGGEPEETSVPTTAPTQPPAATAPTETTGPVPEPTVQTLPSDQLAVETEFGTLYYHSQWSEYMVTEQTRTEQILTVTFFAQMDGVRYALFDVTIGGEEEVSDGWLTDDNGVSRQVAVSLASLEAPEWMSPEEADRLYAMQEDVNFVIEHLK